MRLGIWIDIGFIVKKGKVSSLLKGLVEDMRTVMYPYTADNLKERKHQKTADYVEAAKALGATNLLTFSMTDRKTSLKVCKFPDGPSATFKILQYTLAKYLLLS